MSMFFKGAGDARRLPGDSAGPFRLPLLQGGRCHSPVPAIPPYIMILLAEEALEAQRFDQAEYLIDAVYAFYD